MICISSLTVIYICDFLKTWEVYRELEASSIKIGFLWPFGCLFQSGGHISEI